MDKYDGQLSKVSRTLGINRYTLRAWRDKRKNGKPLLKGKRNPNYKWSKDEMNLVIEYYFNHGECVSKTCQKFGYPAYSTLKEWIKKDSRWKRKHKIHKVPVNLSTEKKCSHCTKYKKQ